MNRSFAAVLTIVVVLSSCSSRQQAFEPFDPDSRSPSGSAIAAYELSPNATRWGTAVVSSRGAYLKEENGASVPVIEIEISVDNHSARELKLVVEETKLKVIMLQGDSLSLSLSRNLRPTLTMLAHMASGLLT